MNRLLSILVSFLLLFFLFSCESAESVTDSTIDAADSSETFSSDSSSRDSGSGGGNGDGDQSQAGLVTAGEWNDLDNWTYWTDLLQTETFANKPDFWSFHTKKRISILVKDDANETISDMAVRLENNGTIIWETKTDNFGKAELFLGLRQLQESIDLTNYTLFVGEQIVTMPIKSFEGGVNEIKTSRFNVDSNKVELSFIVDATGSMADELEFLKKDLLSVIENVKNNSPNLNVLTSTVFYRDEGDEYVVKHSGFSTDPKSTLEFIKQQSADGGGDFPEAVHTALNTALNELKWSNSTKTRIAFLLLDAPPHHNNSVIGELQNAIEKAARLGIKIIPIMASGIDKETEYLMRSFAIVTNGTYVFITNDSGIGGDHLEASVGEYQVEKLNDLMVRLITKYSE